MSVKFLIQFVKTGAELLVTYNEVGIMTDSKFDPAEMINEPTALAVVQKGFPFFQSRLDTWSQSQGVKITEVPDDLTFDRFWAEYAHKFGNKKRAEKLWKELPDTERLKVFKHLPSYTDFLTLNPATTKKYPETYLSQQPWNN